MKQLAQNYIRGSTAVKIAESIEAAVRSGRLEPGAALPTVRQAAAAARVSPATVAAAYQALKHRGVIVCDGRRGTKVSHRSVMQTPATLLPLPPNVRDLRDGNPDPALLPSMADALREIDASPRLYGGTRNDPALLAVATKDFAADGIPPGPIGVAGGALDGIERILREHLRPGDRVALEDPGFGSIVDLVTSLGLVPVPVDLDDEGLIPDSLHKALRSRVQAVIINPRAQNPTGAAISERRAAELRKALLQFTDVLVIEDDHMNLVADAPLHTVVSPAMKRWAVVRSMSKALNPDLRLALMVGDEMTMTRVEDRQAVGGRWVSHVLQRITAHLLKDRKVRRDLAAAAKTYAARREALIKALAGHGIAAQGRSGFNVWVPVPEETPIVQGLLQRGWGISAGERFRLQSPPAVRITAATLQPDEARQLATDWAALQCGRERTPAA